jgi:hypothetical protein
VSRTALGIAYNLDMSGLGILLEQPTTKHILHPIGVDGTPDDQLRHLVDVRLYNWGSLAARRMAVQGECGYVWQAGSLSPDAPACPRCIAAADPNGHLFEYRPLED